MCSQASSLLTRLMNHSILIHQCPYESSSYILITQFLCLLIYSNFLILPQPSPPMGTPWSLNIFKYFISKNILHKLSTTNTLTFQDCSLISLQHENVLISLMSAAHLTSFHSISILLSSPFFRSNLILFCQSLTSLNIFWSHLFSKITLCMR